MLLLLSFLDDPQPPSAALSVISNRADLEFVRGLLSKIGGETGYAVARNLRRIKSVAWLRDGGSLLGYLDESGQEAAVRLVMSADIARARAYSVIEFLLLHGAPGGRRAAAEALAEFSGADANALALSALDDPDPQVQASAVSQLRGRGIPGVLPRLLDMVDIPHAAVREAVRDALDEFTFEHFLRMFDMMDDPLRQSTAALVRKIDPDTVPQLRAELESKLRSRRLRGLQIAEIMGLVLELEPVIIGLLGDEDHMVRAEAAAMLARCPSGASRRALQTALGDRSTTVREAARRSLDAQARTAPAAGDPADSEVRPGGASAELVNSDQPRIGP